MTKDLTLTQRLWDIAMNLYWAWQPETQELFRQLDPDLWESTYHNPVAFLKKLPEGLITKPTLAGRRVCAHVDETFLIVDGKIRHINAQLRPFIQRT